MQILNNIKEKVKNIFGFINCPICGRLFDGEKGKAEHSLITGVFNEIVEAESVCPDCDGEAMIRNMNVYGIAKPIDLFLNISDREYYPKTIG